jgi:hypothetical protein
MLFLRFVFRFVMISVQEYLKKLRDSLAKNVRVARDREDGWLQNRADFIDNAIGPLRPTAHGLDHMLDLVTLPVDVRGQLVDVVQQLVGVMDQERNLGFEFPHCLRHPGGVLTELEHGWDAARNEDHDRDGCKEQGDL